MKKLLAMGIAILVIFSLAVPIASADETLEDETTEISAGDHKSYGWELNYDATLEITMDADDTVNIYLMEEDEYRFYLGDDPFRYNEKGSAEEVSSFSSSVDVQEGGYYLVIENDNLLSSIEVSIEVTADFHKEDSNGGIIPGFTSTLLILAGITAVAIYRKKKR